MRQYTLLYVAYQIRCSVQDKYSIQLGYICTIYLKLSDTLYSKKLRISCRLLYKKAIHCLYQRRLYFKSKSLIQKPHSVVPSVLVLLVARTISSILSFIVMLKLSFRLCMIFIAFLFHFFWRSISESVSNHCWHI